MHNNTITIMKKVIYLIISAVILSLSTACSDSELQKRLDGTWVAHMDAVNSDGGSREATVTLVLNASDLTDTLTIHVPGDKGMLVNYSFDGTWSAAKDQLTLDLSSNKLLQPHIDNVTAKVTKLEESLPDYETLQNPDNSSEAERHHYKMYTEYKAEQDLLEALRKNVACRSTMNIIELTDSTLVIGDNISKINFKRK